jgi:predicted Zn-dependent protease
MIEMVDKEVETEFRIATSLRDDGDLSGARAALEHLSALNPSVFGIWLTLGGIQLSQFDYEATERSLSIAVVLRPASELASLSLFHTLKHLDRTNDAFAEMRRFLAIRPESREYELLRQELDEQRTSSDCGDS